MKKTSLIILLHGLLINSLFAQITIDLPVSSAVFQKNSSGNATIFIAGKLTSFPVSAVEARLLFAGTNNLAVNWTVISSNPTKGNYSGNLTNVPTGWYTLEVRAKKSATILSSASLNRVGVGEVFLIAGQSNAQGFSSLSPPGAVNEKVITHNNSNECGNTIPPYPSFVQLTSTVNPSFYGIEAFCYGRLGDLLANNSNTPVAFFNSAASASSIENWLTSSKNLPTMHPLFGGQFCVPFGSPANSGNPTGIGTPYDGLEINMHYYASMYGTRGILWHQGESDQFLGTSTSMYQNRLDSLITKTRSDFGGNIPWFVSKATYYQNNLSPSVIIAQTNILNSTNKIFSGPSTDDMGSSYRLGDDLHFNGTTGVVELANRWYTSINNNINNATPIESKPVPTVSITTSGANATLTANGTGSISAYRWVDGDYYYLPVLSTNQSYTAFSGNVRCYLTDNYGNIQVTQKINISEIFGSVNNTASCTNFAYLSDFKPYSVTNGYGPAEFDMSVGAASTGDGHTLKLNGINYSKGLGVHANSQIVYKINPGTYSYLTAVIGIDDEMISCGTVSFKVYGDNVLLYSSGIKTPNSANESIQVSIDNVSELKLVVDDAGDGNDCDHADWADLKLVCGDANPPTDPSNLSISDIKTKCLTLNWDQSIDNNGISAYKIYKDGNYVTSVANNVLSYTFTGLNGNSSHTFGVKAVDLYNLESDLVSLPGQSQLLTVSYGPGNDICLNDPTTPTASVTGGIFKFISGEAATLNSSTGEITKTTEGISTIRYVIFQGQACADSVTINMNAFTKPASTTITTTSALKISSGTNAAINALACPQGTYLWSTLAFTQNINVIVNDSTSYFVRCRSGCLSDKSNIIRFDVIPGCSSFLNLKSPDSDINLTNGLLPLKSSTNINASNKLSGSTQILYQAANYILLTPGFEITNGTVFSTSIQGCP